MTQETLRNRDVDANLLLGADYRPENMRLSVVDKEDMRDAEIELDPITRKLPGALFHLSFFMHFTSLPEFPKAFPLLLKVYADRQLRWQRPIGLPTWPDTGGTGKAAPGDGMMVSLSAGEGNRLVETPREIHGVLTDANGHPVGEARYTLLDAETTDAASRVLDTIQHSLDTRRFGLVPPPPD